MDGHDWTHVGLLMLNLVFAGLAYVARLQMKVATHELREYVDGELASHDINSNAHANHGLSLALEERFKQVMATLNTVVTELAVLNERLKNKLDKGAR